MVRECKPFHVKNRIVRLDCVRVAAIRIFNIHIHKPAFPARVQEVQFAPAPRVARCARETNSLRFAPFGNQAPRRADLNQRSIVQVNRRPRLDPQRAVVYHQRAAHHVRSSRSSQGRVACN